MTDKYKRNAIARNGTLASALSTMLDELHDDEMEQIVLFDNYNEVTGDCSSLAAMPPVESSHRFYAWSENWVFYDDGDSSFMAGPSAVPRHPTTTRNP